MGKHDQWRNEFYLKVLAAKTKNKKPSDPEFLFRDKYANLIVAAIENGIDSIVIEKEDTRNAHFVALLKRIGISCNVYDEFSIVNFREKPSLLFSLSETDWKPPDIINSEEEFYQKFPFTKNYHEEEWIVFVGAGQILSGKSEEKLKRIVQKYGAQKLSLMAMFRAIYYLFSRNVGPNWAMVNFKDYKFTEEEMNEIDSIDAIN